MWRSIVQSFPLHLGFPGEKGLRRVHSCMQLGNAILKSMPLMYILKVHCALSSNYNKFSRARGQFAEQKLMLELQLEVRPNL